MIPERPLKIAMLILIPLTAIFIMRSRSFRQDGTDGRPVSRRALMWAAVLSGAIGVYDGVYGPGTGTFLILTLVSVVHLSVREANGATKMINLATNISALVVFLWHGQVLWVLGLVAGGFSMLGNYLGAVLFGRRGASVVRPVMLTVMVIFFIKVVFDLWC